LKLLQIQVLSRTDRLRRERRAQTLVPTRGSEFDEIAFFAAIDTSDARALLIGRRALVILGLPVLTADYDFWLHPEDIETLNEALQTLDLEPNQIPAKHDNWADTCSKTTSMSMF
jgi:hypothetical protein